MKNNGAVAGFFMALLVGVGILNFFYLGDAPELSAVILMLVSFLCFFYALIKRGVLSEIIGSIILAVIVIFIGMIPVVGQFFLIAFVIYNLIKTLKSIRSLISSAIISLLLYGSLFLEMYGLDSIISLIIYLVISIGFVAYLSEAYPDKEDFLLKISLILCSIPLIAVLVMSITSTLRNLFNVAPVSKVGTKAINVGEYARGDSIVSAHTRNIATTVTSVETSVNAGSAITSSVAKTGSELSEDKK